MSIPLRKYKSIHDPDSALVALETLWVDLPPSRDHQVLDLRAYWNSIDKDIILTFHRVGQSGKPVARPRTITVELLDVILRDVALEENSADCLEDRYGIREIIIRDLRARLL